MSEKRNIQPYSATDIEKYWQGKLSPAEMHAMEKAALEDSFLADAMEGYKHTLTIQEDLAGLKEQLDKKISGGKVLSISSTGSSWWKIAASVILVGGIAYAAYQYTSARRGQDIAKADSVEKKEKPAILPAEVPEPGDSSVKIPAAAADNTKPESNAAGTEKSSSGKATGINDDEVTGKPTDTTAAYYEVAADNRPAVSKAAESRIAAPAPSQEKPGKVSASDSVDIAVMDTRNKEYLTENAIKTKVENGNGFAGLPETTDKKRASKKKNSSFKFSGRIVDADNNGIENAGILNLTNSEVTLSGKDGYFTVPAGEDSLVLLDISSQGYLSREFRLNRFDRKPADLVLYEIPEDDSPGEITVSAELSEEYAPVNNNTAAVPAAVPENGWVLYNQYLEKNIRADKSDFTTGEVILKFSISKSGKAVNIVVSRPLSPANDAEAIRLLKSGPGWIATGKSSEIRISLRFH